MIDENKLIEEVKSLRITITGLRAEKGVLNEYAQYLKDLVIQIIDEQPKVGEWIPVEEGLPKNNRNYPYYEINLVTIENGDVCLGVYRHSDKEWLTRMSEGETVYSNKHKVTAWKPRPEPYRKEDNK